MTGDYRDRLDERYGRPSAVRRRLVPALAVIAAVVFGVWLAWAVWVHGNDPVSGGIESFDVVDEHTATAVVRVRLEEGTEATCLLRATAEDKTTVGEETFTPVDGRNEVTVRTERLATTVDLVSCDAD